MISYELPEFSSIKNELFTQIDKIIGTLLTKAGRINLVVCQKKNKNRSPKKITNGLVKKIEQVFTDKIAHFPKTQNIGFYFFCREIICNS